MSIGERMRECLKKGKLQHLPRGITDRINHFPNTQGIMTSFLYSHLRPFMFSPLKKKKVTIFE